MMCSMNAARSTVPSVLADTPARRSDACSARLGQRAVGGRLLWDIYGTPYKLPAAFLGVRADQARWIVSRWRRAGFAETRRLDPGPAWCCLTHSALAVTGQHCTPGRPVVSRLAHIRAVLARLVVRELPSRAVL